MITMGIANPPPDTVSWIPIFYEDPAIPYAREIYPSQKLGLQETWYTAEIGTGLGLFSLGIQGYSDDPIYPSFVYGSEYVEWLDGQYIFDVTAEQLFFEPSENGVPAPGGQSLWPFAAGAGVIGALIIAKRQRK